MTMSLSGWGSNQVFGNEKKKGPSQWVSASYSFAGVVVLLLAIRNKAPKVGIQTAGPMWLLHCPPSPSPQPLFSSPEPGWSQSSIFMSLMAAIIISPLNGSFQVSISLIMNVRRKEHQDCFGLLSKIGILSRYSYSLGAKVVMGGRTDPRSTNWFPSLYLPKHSSSPGSGPVP